MGDYSRDTFQLTNVMHQLLANTPVALPRHYTGVRLQQGMPVMDADINELDDIRNHEVRALLNYFIGNGVPAGNSGFLITGAGAANDFTINSGVMLVDGLVVINPAVTTYLAQAEAASLPALTTPPGGSDRIDLVYLDIWEQEVGAADTLNPDERIVNPFVGIETSRRIERRWAVRVAPGQSDLSALVEEAGHHYSALALLQRSGGMAAIRDAMVIDQRRLGITLADNLKIPIYIRRGIEIVDSGRFANMLEGLRTTLFTRLLDSSIPYQTAGVNAQRDETLLLMSLQQLMQLSQVGENQALTSSLNNADALGFLIRLHAAQDSWLTLLADIGNNAAVADTFLAQYRALLGSAITPTGLYAQLGNLLRAVVAQEEINSWLSASVGNLPEGTVQALYQITQPYQALAAGVVYELTYLVTANFTSPEVSEEFSIIASLDAAFGTVSVNPASLAFTPPQESATVTVTVTPSGVLALADLDLVVQAQRNPINVRSSQPPISLAIGALPPVATYYFYTGPLSVIERRFEIPQNHLTRPQGRNVLFRLRNDSATEQRTYQVRRQIVPNTGNTSGWAPLAFADVVGSPFTLNPATELDVLANVLANDAGNVPALGTTGLVQSSAQLIEVDGMPVVEVQPVLVVDVNFVVVAAV
jgi:hypothetical protein